MKKIFLGLITALFFIGCGEEKAVDTNVEPKIVTGKSVASIKLNDQFSTPHTINSDTKKLVFAFSKASAHTCNDYFDTKDPRYLTDNDTQFVADVSAAPSLIRSMFIMPGLKDFKHTVLILEDKAIAATYRAGLDTEKIIIASLNNGTISNIQSVSSLNELIKIIEAK